MECKVSNEIKKYANSPGTIVGNMISFAAALGVAWGVCQIGNTPSRNTSPYQYPADVNSPMHYDINGDGLADTVQSDGSIYIQNTDGTATPFQEYVNNQIERVKSNYTLQKGEDGRYYTGLESSLSD